MRSKEVGAAERLGGFRPVGPARRARGAWPRALAEAGCAPRLARLGEAADGTYGWAELEGWD
ncbi:hypothetical protein, partial [Streptomyces sp. NPDC046976]|uniref:hypothetical protein n=1 Tax=Streptomyces sp. NPDC046976 TaxID=3155258 RepID=UPI003408DEA8